MTAGVLDQVLDQVLAELRGNSCPDTDGVKLNADLCVQDLSSLQLCGRPSTDFHSPVPLAPPVHVDLRFDLLQSENFPGRHLLVDVGLVKFLQLLRLFPPLLTSSMQIISDG